MKITLNKDIKKVQLFTNSTNAKIQFAKTDAANGDSDTTGTLEGYAIVWNAQSDLRTDDNGTQYRVAIAPNSVNFANPTMALFHHDYQKIIGNTENNTLIITPDNYGVKVQIKLPNTSVGRDTAELVDKQYVKGMSFSLLTDGSQYTEQVINGDNVLTYTKFDSDEVTVTGVPAMGETSIAVVGNPVAPQITALAEDEKTNKNNEGIVAERLKLERMKLDMYSPSEL